MLETERPCAKFGDVLHFQTTDEVLHVLQGEYAISRPSSNTPRFLGSSDATTCLIAAVKMPNNVVIAHLDCEDACEYLVQRCEQLIVLDRSCAAELWMLGSCEDKQLISEGILQALTSALRSSRIITFKVKGAVVLKDNTAPAGGPIHTGLVYDTLHGIAHPAIFEIDKTEETIPRRTRRLARRWLGALSESSTDIPILENIWDMSREMYRLNPFSCNISHRIELLLSYYLMLPDDKLLETVSTTPEFEPSHFCNQQRDTFRWILRHKSASIPQQNYKWDKSSSAFVLVDPASSIPPVQVASVNRSRNLALQVSCDSYVQDHLV